MGNSLLLLFACGSGRATACPSRRRLRVSPEFPGRELHRHQDAAAARPAAVASGDDGLTGLDRRQRRFASYPHSASP